MSTNPSYLQSAADGRVKNFRDWGLPLGRRFRALKLWFLIREQGVSGLQQRLRRDLDNAQWLAGQVRGAPGWRLLAPVPLQTLCVRHEPDGAATDGDALESPYAGMGRAREPIGGCVPHTGTSRQPLDGARLDRRRADRANARRGALGDDAEGDRTMTIAKADPLRHRRGA